MVILFVISLFYSEVQSAKVHSYMRYTWKYQFLISKLFWLLPFGHWCHDKHHVELPGIHSNPCLESRRFSGLRSSSQESSTKLCYRRCGATEPNSGRSGKLMIFQDENAFLEVYHDEIQLLVASGICDSPQCYRGIRAVENKTFDMFMSKIEAMQSWNQLIFTVLSVQYFHGLWTTWFSHRYWDWNIFGSKEQNQPNMYIMVEWHFNSFLVLFFFFFFFPLYEVPCVRLHTGNSLVLRDTISRLWFQIILFLLVYLFSLPLFSLIYLWYIHLSSLFPHCEGTQAVEQDAQRNCSLYPWWLSGLYKYGQTSHFTTLEQEIRLETRDCKSFQPDLACDVVVSSFHLIFFLKINFHSFALLFLGHDIQSPCLWKWQYISIVCDCNMQEFCCSNEIKYHRSICLS